MFTRFAQRSNEAELMDGSDYSLDELVENLADLRRVNRLLGGQNALATHLFPMIESLVKEHGDRPLRLLDVGTGSADIPAMIVDWARAQNLKIEFVVLDLNEIAARESLAQTASYPEIKVVRADAMTLPFADSSFDFVLASLFLHHFETPHAATLLKSFARVARTAFIINDLRRHPVAYYSIKLLTRIFTRNRLVRNDAAVSVLRGFTERDIAEIARQVAVPIHVFRHFPYRIILIGRT
jgi:hypothetical protein